MNTVIQTYLKKRAEKEPWILKISPEKKKYKFIICIPAYAELNHLPLTLKSIDQQDKKLLDKTLVIIVINNGPNPYPKVLKNNEHTKKLVLSNSQNFEVIPVDAYSKGLELPEKFAGVGLARKIGFDLALPYSDDSTIFCNLDADSLISDHYLIKVKEYFDNPDKSAGVTKFSHQTPVLKENAESIQIYEKFIRNTSLKLTECGSPYYYHAIGSTIVCRTDAYAAVSGMSRRKATEDFYFLQELAKYKSVGIIEDAIVHPSARESDRVYLGTGFRMNQAKNGFDLNTLNYTDDSFAILKDWIILGVGSRNISVEIILSKSEKIHLELPVFLKNEKIESIWKGLQKSSPSEKHFEKQFHRWFDALKTFRLLKYFSTK